MADDTTGTNRDLNICGVAGSLRHDSYNRSLLATARELAPDGMRISAHTLHGIPVYDGDLERQEIPASVVALAEAVRSADGLLIVSPEYNHGIPGVLKNAIDWLSRDSVGNPFPGMPATVMGVSSGAIGTARGQIQIRQVLLTLGAIVMPAPEVLVGPARERFDEQRLLHHERTREFVVRHLERFRGHVRMVRGDG